jgi:dihydroorotate dehydrogenase electron transfer subunit
MNKVDTLALVLKKELLADDIVRMTCDAPEVARLARPGQFVMVRPGKGYDPLLRRPFSLHQVTGQGWIQVLFKIVGKGTAMLAETGEREKLEITGPLGQGFELKSRDKFCLIGGGMGIAPLFYLATEIQRQKPGARTLALLGARNSGELQQLAAEFAGIGVKLFLATDDGSLGHHGFVHELMTEHMLGEVDWQVCTCGPHPMMKSVARICDINGWHCQVSLETMMACGFGACLGCAVPRRDFSGDYLHVCKDGPVFDANEVAWL